MLKDSAGWAREKDVDQGYGLVEVMVVLEKECEEEREGDVWRRRE